MADVFKAFSFNLWWRFREKISLWFDIMEAKYCKAKHPMQVQQYWCDSFTWKRMLAVWQIAEDMMIWKLSSLGQFSLKSAYDCVHEYEILDFFFKHILDPYIPLKISFFILRLLYRKLPLADVLQKFSIHGLSCCFNCLSPSLESQKYAFSLGKIPSKVWDFFGGPTDISLRKVPFRMRMMQ